MKRILVWFTMGLAAVAVQAGASVGMVVIPAGTYSGTIPDSGGLLGNLKVYSLTVTNSFYMDAMEVSKAQRDTVYTWAVAYGYSFDNAGSGKPTLSIVRTTAGSTV